MELNGMGRKRMMMRIRMRMREVCCIDDSVQEG
jgi:hypothetical protein